MRQKLTHKDGPCTERVNVVVVVTTSDTAPLQLIGSHFHFSHLSHPSFLIKVTSLMLT